MIEPRYILDSNILIYVLGGASNRLRHRMEAYEPGSLVVSAIAYAEVMRGIKPGDQTLEAQADRLFEMFPVIPFDRVAADLYRTVPFRRGRFDSLIAAHAIALALPLVTNNERDFADVPDLRVENWTL